MPATIFNSRTDPKSFFGIMRTSGGESAPPAGREGGHQLRCKAVDARADRIDEGLCELRECAGRFPRFPRAFLRARPARETRMGP